MTTKTVGRRRTLGLLTLVLIVGALVSVTTPAEATRTVPDFVTAFEPGLAVAIEVFEALGNSEKPNDTFVIFNDDDLSLFAALSFLDASEIGRLNAENRFRLFTIAGEIPPLVKHLLTPKTALPASTSALECNVLAPRDLANICGSLSFQGTWTDPVTGLAYHRHRWYDPRTANWLSEDPLGAVDSPNLYAGFGWAPHVYTDPMGNILPRGAQWDAGTQLYKHDGKWYQVNINRLVYEIDIQEGARHTLVRNVEIAKAVRAQAGAGGGGDKAFLALAQGVSDRSLAYAEAYEKAVVIAGSITDVGGTIEDLKVIATGTDLEGNQMSGFDKGLSVVGLAPFVSGRMLRAGVGLAEEGVDLAKKVVRRGDDIPGIPASLLAPGQWVAKNESLVYAARIGGEKDRVRIS